MTPSPTPRRRRWLALVLLTLPLAACEQPRVALEVTFPEDGGSNSCKQFNDLACVNFLRFQLTSGEEFLTHCTKMEERLITLCDLPYLAHGDEVFRRREDEEVEIKVTGLRVFPATSCESNPECPPRELFSGSTGLVRLGDVSGGGVALTITNAAHCGNKEEFRPADDGRSCEQICTGDNPLNEVVCEVQGGCVCGLAGTARASTDDDAGIGTAEPPWVAAVDGGI